MISRLSSSAAFLTTFNLEVVNLPPQVNRYFRDAKQPGAAESS